MELTFDLGGVSTKEFADAMPEPIDIEAIALSEEQQEVVTTEEDKVILVAGAGSGKTRVLTERLKYLLESGVAPSNIVAITFTRLAAQEMEKRLINAPGVGDCFIGTIHAFANKVYDASGEDFEIFGEQHELRYMKYLIDKYAISLTMEEFTTFKDNQVEADRGKIDESVVMDHMSMGSKYELGEFYNIDTGGIATLEIQDRDYPETIYTLCKKYNVITFDELIEKATEYYKSIGASIEHLLVDEFQDVGNLENRFIRDLNAENYFLVGDDWQAIYGFKGGNQKHFLDRVRSDEWKTFYLEDNYRNSKAIHEMGQRIIGQVDNKIEKNVRLKSEEEGEVVVDSKRNIRNYFQAIKKMGNYKDWFVLARSNKDVYNLQTWASELGLPVAGLDKASMTPEQLEAELNKNVLHILTVHKSKGLENKYGLLYGNFPVQEPSYYNNPEERRVMYVGATRFMLKLAILN